VNKEGAAMKKGKLIGKIFGIALVFVMLASTLGGLVWARESDMVGDGYVDVSVEQAKGMIDSAPDIIVLDVRTENEYEAGHIAGAGLVPLSELEQRTGELDKDDALLVYCKSGTKSVEASNILIQHEFESVYNMEGGINAWVNAGYPVVSSSLGDQSGQGCSCAESQSSITSTSNNLLSSEIDAILDADKPVFLFFYADWCHFCQEQLPIIDELELEYTEEIIVIRVNSEDNPQAMEEFGVTAFPTMFLVSDKSADGEYRYQEFQGFTDKETLNQSFDRVITNGNISEGSGVDSDGIGKKASEVIAMAVSQALYPSGYESLTEAAATCPDNCECLTDAAAEEQGLTLCNGELIECIVYSSPVAAPVLGHCYQAAEEPVVCQDADINLSQVHLESGEIKFIADISCPVAKVDMIIGGVKVQKCAGGYCEYTGGPYGAQDIPAFSAILYDDLNNLLTTSNYVSDEITVSLLDDIPELGEFDPCPFCPEPEPEWGELVSCTCDGNDHFQVYDWTSHVQLTSCIYENHALTVGYVDLGEGLVVEVQITDPIFDYCINEDDIVLHKCQNGVYIAEYTYTCPYGCDGGQCICSDTDGGIDLYEYGGVCDGSTSVVSGATDYCLDEHTLREYYTEIDYVNNSCTIKWMDFECPGVCEDGACHGTCSDGIQNEGETGIDCGGPCLAACEYDVGWYAQNYGFKFQNPSGQHLSYGDCWSTSKSCSKGYGNYKDTFGNCEVCICRCFGCCCGWHVHAGLYYLIYRYLGALAGQCTGMSLSSLRFYYGDQDPQDYDPWAYEVIDLEYTGTLKNNIAARQGKVVSGENIDHYLFHSSYWGTNDVLNKVEDALDNDPPDYGMIFMIEDNGWGGWHDTVRQTPWAHTVVATNVEYISSDVARIYIYDPNVPSAEYPTANSPYVNIDNSPYIDINTQSNSYTYVDDPSDPPTDSEGEPISNSNDELFDRIGYIPYSKLAGDVDIPWEFDLLVIGIVAALGTADAQVEDGEGATLGFSEEGPDAPTIENAMILPVFGEPDPETPPVFALPMGDYKINIRGTGSGNYSAYILGDSPHAFAISDAEVSEGTRDTIALQYGAEGRAMLSFSTSDVEKQYSLQIASLGEDNGDATETLYGVTNSTISSGSKALFSVDPDSHSLLYTNYGDTAVKYSLQIYRATIPPEEMEMANPMGSNDVSTAAGGAGIYADALTATNYGAADLGDTIDGIQLTEVYTFMIEPMETHILSPEDWSNLPASEIVVETEKCGDGDCGAHENYFTCPEDCPSGAADYYCDGVSDGICDPDCTVGTDPDCKAPLGWPLIVGIIGGLAIIGIVAFLLARKRGGSPQAGQ
jgi:rhodanese-related sulfurtransferase